MIKNNEFLNTEITLNIDQICFLEKPRQEEDVPGIRNRLAKGTKTMKVSELITHIERGGSFTPAAMKSRDGASWQSQQIIVADIDNTEPELGEDGKPIKGKKKPLDNPLLSDEALRVCREHGIQISFMYHTFSNSPEVERYRAVCILDRPVDSVDEGVDLTARLSEIMDAAAPGALDFSMADAARLIYGSTKGSVFSVSGFTSIESLRALPKSSKANSSTQQPARVLRNVQELVLPSSSSLEYIELNTSCTWFKDFVEKHNIPVLRTVEKADRMIYGVVCPWSDQHSEDTGILQSAVLIEADGKLRYVCQHSHCKDKGWKDFRAFYEKADKSDSEQQKKLDVKLDANLPKVVTVDDIQESEAAWLIDDVMPQGQISIWGGDGGSGKGFLTCDTIAGLTTGKTCLLDMQVPRYGFEDYSDVHVREPKTVMYLSGEDSFEVTLRRRLRKAGADMKRVLTMDFSSQLDAGISTDSPALEKVIDLYRPDLLVIDPLESFLGERVKMAERNSMRQAMKPLLKYGEQYGLTTLIIAHSNKGKSVWGRKRLADSSDLWDIARSVFLLGRTPDKHRYISHEKSNYSPLQKTIIFDITPDETVAFVDYSELTDREFVLAETWDNQGKSTRTDAKEFILDTLKQAADPVPVKELDELGDAVGISATTMKRAKTELKKDGKVKFTCEGFGKDKKYYITIA